MDASDLFYYAAECDKRSDYKNAIRAYNLLLKKEMGDWERQAIYGELLSCHAQMGKYKKAYSFYKKIAKNPSLCQYFFNSIMETLSKVRKKAPKPEEMVKASLPVWELKGVGSELYEFDREAALKLYEKAMRRRYVFQVLRWLLKRRYEKGEMEWGLKLIRSLKKRHPELALFEADFLLKMGETSAALGLLEKTRFLLEDLVLFRKAQALFALKKPQEAYWALMEINPAFISSATEPPKVAVRAAVYPVPLELQVEKTAEPTVLACIALALLRGVYPAINGTESVLQNPEASNLAGLSCYYRKEYANASYHFERALLGMKGTERQDIHFSLANALYRNGQKERAQEHLAKAGLGCRLEEMENIETLCRLRGQFELFAGSEKVKYARSLQELRRIKGKCRKWKVFCALGPAGLRFSALASRIGAEKAAAKMFMPQQKIRIMQTFLEAEGMIGAEKPKASLFVPRLDEAKLRGKKGKVMRRALIHYRKGIKEELVLAMELLGKLRPLKGVLNNLGCMHYALQDYIKALECFEKALSLDRNYEVAKFNKILAHASVENYPEAIRAADSMRKKDALVLHLRGMCNEYSGNREQARVDYTKALELDPGFSEARTHLEVMCLTARGPETRRAEGMLLQSQPAPADAQPVRSSLDFSHVGGMREMKGMFTAEIIMPLKKPELARKYGKRTGGGYLLYGPPGCGKSFIVEALAGEAKLSMVKANISDILNMYVGNSEKNLAAVFEAARKSQPSIIFFDEIEALGGKREGLDQHWQKTLVNVFLQEMDRIGKNDERIVVLGATNAPWEIDLALRRSGRLGKEIFVDPPDEKARREILEIYTRNLPLENVDLDEIASLTGNYSAANIKSICERAANRAWKDALEGNERKITKDDFLEALKGEKSDVVEWMDLARRNGTIKEGEFVRGRMYG